MDLQQWNAIVVVARSIFFRLVTVVEHRKVFFLIRERSSQKKDSQNLLNDPSGLSVSIFWLRDDLVLF